MRNITPNDSSKTSHRMKNYSINTMKQLCNDIELETDEWLLVAAFLLILIVGVFGNSFVIYVFGYRRRKVGRLPYR